MSTSQPVSVLFIIGSLFTISQSSPPSHPNQSPVIQVRPHVNTRIPYSLSHPPSLHPSSLHSYGRGSFRSQRPYYGRVGSGRGVLMSSPSSSIFIPRALWMDPMDYPVPPFIPSPTLNAFVSSGYSSSPGVTSSASEQSLNPSDQRTSSGTSSLPSHFVPPSLTYSPILAVLGQNATNQALNGVGQDQANFEKTLFELLNSNSNTNISVPLTSEKYFWTFSQDPTKWEPLFFHSLGAQSPTPMFDNLDGSNNNVISNQESVKQDGSTLLYKEPTEHLKVVSLCDKTLALLDYGNPTSTKLLHCELYDLEKNPESAYTEAKKTGIPIQSVSFREMREIINACRVLAEGEFNPNTVHVAPPPPAVVSHSHLTMDHFGPTNNNKNNQNNSINSNESFSVTTPTTPSASNSISSSILASPSLSSPGSSSSSSSSATSSGLSVVASPSGSASSSSSSVTVVGSPVMPSSPSPVLGSATVSSSPSTSSTSSTSTTSTSDKGSSSWMWSSWRALLPGTKWCGLGDSARNYFDLGKRKDVDVCCRAHDHCPIRLKALRMGYGLINLSLYTKSHCDCDEDFKRCLKQANSKSAEMLANFYFNIMKIQCIREDFPFVCKEYRKNKSTGSDECIRYEEDASKKDKMVFVQPETVTF